MIAQNDNARKWIYSSLAIFGFLLALLTYKFLLQMGAWFDLETKVKNYILISQILSVGISGVAFFALIKNEKSAQFLYETYDEMLKVVFPDRSETFRHAIIIMIVVTIIGFILGMFDFGAGYLLSKLPSF